MSGRLLSSSAKQVCYEAEMLDEAFGQLLINMARRQEIPYRLSLEAFLLHCRNIIDFLHGTPRSDDVSAEHFVKDANAWRSSKPALPTNLKLARRAMNKLLAHLTYARRDYARDKWQWEVPRLRAHCLNSLQIFRTHLARHRRKWFASLPTV